MRMSGIENLKSNYNEFNALGITMGQCGTAQSKIVGYCCVVRGVDMPILLVSARNHKSQFHMGFVVFQSMMTLDS